MFLKILLLTVIVLGIAFAAIAIKMFVKKDGEFKKQCSTIDPDTGKTLDAHVQVNPVMEAVVMMKKKKNLQFLFNLKNSNRNNWYYIF